MAGWQLTEKLKLMKRKLACGRKLNQLQRNLKAKASVTRRENIVCNLGMA